MTEINRVTKETDITVSLNMSSSAPVDIVTPLPFFNHMLHAMAFHGGFSLAIQAAGDIEVDPHHLVEDVGLVLGQAIRQESEKQSPVARFGQSIIPMDDALCETVIDNCGRPFLYYSLQFPQPYSGQFDMSLLKEFFLALAHQSAMNLHLESRHGENSHHIAEALFKSLGRALNQACKMREGKEDLSTKGLL